MSATTGSETNAQASKRRCPVPDVAAGESDKCDFWLVVDETLLDHYPECRFDERDRQLELGDFGSGGELKG
ncbi:hypothetical protein [Natrinema versiforme]|uniref:hypothetical protein n=1 Tax=Natrinema versiforme TaxID=88724 RepID=UPI001586CCB9|nr:hypothetical protein [Natrinema versiforme]